MVGLIVGLAFCGYSSYREPPSILADVSGFRLPHGWAEGSILEELENLWNRAEMRTGAYACYDRTLSEYRRMVAPEVAAGVGPLEAYCRHLGRASPDFVPRHEYPEYMYAYALEKWPGATDIEGNTRSPERHRASSGDIIERLTQEKEARDRRRDLHDLPPAGDDPIQRVLRKRRLGIPIGRTLQDYRAIAAADIRDGRGAGEGFARHLDEAAGVRMDKTEFPNYLQAYALQKWAAPVGIAVRTALKDGKNYAETLAATESLDYIPDRIRLALAKESMARLMELERAEREDRMRHAAQVFEDMAPNALLRDLGFGLGQGWMDMASTAGNVNRIGEHLLEKLPFGNKVIVLNRRIRQGMRDYLPMGELIGVDAQTTIHGRYADLVEMGAAHEPWDHCVVRWLIRGWPLWIMLGVGMYVPARVLRAKRCST
jgi:hypothetical protein